MGVVSAFKRFLMILDVGPVGQRTAMEDAVTVDNDRTAGFSLLELLVVMTIVGMIIALVAPRLPDFHRRMALRTAASELAAALRQAQSTAMARQSETYVAVDLAHRSFQASNDPRSRPLPTDARIQLLTARSQVVTGDLGKVTFFPDGSSTGGRILLSRQDASIAIDIAWLNGMVRVR